ncbi:MAG: ABC transporter permease [Firmicutes bacterium]|nr:ABC transporter permease [Bacillota bacterium]
MYVLKNALVSISRNKGRNILIGIIIVVISAACAITLSIRNSADKIVTAYESKYNVEATIGMDRNALMESLRGGSGDDKNSQEEMIEKFNEIKNITVEEINSYGNSEYVSSYYYVYNTNMDAKDLEEATDSLVKETTTTTTKTDKYTTTFGGEAPPGRPGGQGGNRGSTTTKKSTTTTKKTEKIFNEKAANGAFSIMGYSSYEAMSDFITGNYTISEGEVSSDFTSNNCVISEELATLNELKVGDTIKLVNPDNSKLTYELIVSGIYKENTDEASDMKNMFSNSANTIITNSTMLEKIIADDEDLGVTVTPTFILTSTDVADKFSEEVKSKGLSEYYTVSNNVDTVTGATKSISNVKTFATTFLIITLIIGGVVLLVINMINIRERKYEIGVLRTIGMKRITVISQFMIELLIVCVFGLLIGAGIGAVSSVSVANSLLANEIENASTDMEGINQNFGGGMNRPSDVPDDKGDRVNRNNNNFNGVVTIEQVDSMEAVVDFKVLLQLLAIGVSLTIISSISSCVAIARFSPLTILKERS